MGDTTSPDTAGIQPSGGANKRKRNDDMTTPSPQLLRGAESSDDAGRGAPAARQQTSAGCASAEPAPATITDSPLGGGAESGDDAVDPALVTIAAGSLVRAWTAWIILTYCGVHSTVGS
jgi:hypothetical protein